MAIHFRGAEAKRQTPPGRLSDDRRVPRLGAEHLAVDLADRRQRDRVEDVDLSWVLVAADVLATPRDELLRGDRRAGMQRDERDDLLAVARVGPADDGGDGDR